MISLYLIS